MKELKIQYKPVDDLRPYDKNAKKHDKEQIKNVAESIKKYGFIQPLVIDKNNIIVIGHCRFLAAQKLKLDKVPCTLVDDLTEEQVKELRIVDNKTNESEWDFDLLSTELEEIELPEFDFDFGIDVAEKESLDSKIERKDIELNETISVVIDCENEEEAETIFNNLSEEGYNCHISTL